MRVITPNCPACGGVYDGKLSAGILTCEYCGSKFALDPEVIEVLGLQERESWEAEDEDGTIEDLPSMEEFAREACGDFVARVGQDDFHSSKKIMDGLGVDDYEEVFLIHDDTIFKSGKNGFAITDYGLYCREMGESETNYLRWGDFAEAEKPEKDGSYIKVGGTSIAYFTGNAEILDELRSLYRKLRKHARNVDWVDPE